jgi:hypothetical protein
MWYYCECLITLQGAVNTTPWELHLDGLGYMIVDAATRMMKENESEMMVTKNKPNWGIVCSPKLVSQYCGSTNFLWKIVKKI